MAEFGKRTCVLVAGILASAFPDFAASAKSVDPLREGFSNPPSSARPRVWWHWMNGNITKDGIAKDLAWMKRVGIGGVQNFDANLATPQIVQKRLVYMTSDWKDAFRFAVSTAQQDGLEFAVAGSPGWSETGGPWVPPADGIKKLSWSETEIVGGQKFVGQIPSPPTTTGPFQKLAPSEPFAGKGTVPEYYRDVALLAVPAFTEHQIDPSSVTDAALHAIDKSRLEDADLDSAVELPLSGSGPPVLSFAYAAPVTVRSATIYIQGGGLFGSARYAPILEAQIGNEWRKIGTFSIDAVPTTLSFAPVTSDHFRLTIAPDPKPNPIGWAVPNPGVIVPPILGLGAKPTSVKIGEFRLSESPKVDRFESKAGYSLVENYYALQTTAAADEKGVDPSKVINLTGLMSADGTLDWTAPPGVWKLLRIGYSLTGKPNHPATAEATGLEVDKLDGAAVRRYFQHYLGTYRDTVGPDLIGKAGLRAIVTDSTEVGTFNWTPAMIDQFRRLRGYDPTPWLPALTGTIIGSRAESDEFLYDFRRTLAELHATQHYGTVAAVAHENGLKVYGEALEDKRPVIGDDMEMRRFTDVPMAALWSYQPARGPRTTLLGDMKGASSAAHLYGQNLAAAESMTSALMPWAHAPADLRPIIDLEFAYGINRPVIHTSVHQPVDDKVPGLSLLIFGQFFNRHETWAEMARPWIDYISRSSFMLQQGRNVADVAYFYGEESPLTALFAQQPPGDLPRSHPYDFINADALLNVVRVEGGDIVAPSGARYSAIYLGGTSQRMTLSTLRRLSDMARSGATIIGKAPSASPSLRDDPGAFRQLVNQLWAGGAVTNVGKGRIVDRTDLDRALDDLGVQPDFHVGAGDYGSSVLFVHRKLSDGEVYYLNNRAGHEQQLDARFRVTGKAPELWHADTGATEPASFRVEGDETVVPLHLTATESVFVVFRKPSTARARTVPAPELTSIARIDGPWDVAFQEGRGAPAVIKLASLASLTAQPDPGVKYYSGVATYTKAFMLPKRWRPGHSLWLDLGQVGDIAKVTVNGKLVGTAWHAPYRLDIGKAAKRGPNRLQIQVADLWVNRLIGDAQQGAKRVTFTTIPTYTADAPLRPSGLIGPVQLLSAQSR